MAILQVTKQNIVITHAKMIYYNPQTALRIKALATIHIKIIVKMYFIELNNSFYRTNQCIEVNLKYLTPG